VTYLKAAGCDVYNHNIDSSPEFYSKVITIRTSLTRIRLSAGRMQLSRESQALCFAAGANSIFSGAKLLTTPLPGQDFDDRLVANLTKPLSDFSISAP